MHINQILDETTEVLILKKTFSKWAFGTAIITTTLIVYYATQIPSEMKASDVGKPFIPLEFASIMLLSCLLGFVFTIISFVKKEPSSVIKWAGAIINIIPFLIMVWSFFGILFF